VTKENLFTINNFLKKNINRSLLTNLTKKFNIIFAGVNKDINDPKKTLNVLNDEFKFNFKIKDLGKFKKYKKIAIIGMGGSILGTKAINNFLKGKIEKKIYFFDNLNPEKILNFKKKENLKKILFLIISKSGNTVETLSSLFALNIIKKNSPNIIIISEKKDNQLFNLSRRYNLFHIEHNNFIGGRYSVLSEVGVVPAYLMDININNLRSGIKKFLKGKKKLFLKNSTIKLTEILNEKKIKNLIFLNYAPELEDFLFWCQQLIAESLGKKNKGLLPTVSNVPKDHHSLMQLYLDGPRDKLFHIFSIEKKEKEKISTKKILNKNNLLHDKTLGEIKRAQRLALIKVLKNNKIPYREFKINNKNEKILGELFSYFILETVIVGRLAKLNPFNQPAVEQIKSYTQKLLR
jgi:glucose-6-phosphate isomerase